MTLPSLTAEKEAWLQDKVLCGIDEVGRGSLAGPVVAASVVMPQNHIPIPGIRDSKKLSIKKREELFEEIIKEALDFGLGLVGAPGIDDLGIVMATKKAMVRSIDSLSQKPDLAIIDALFLEEIDIEQKSIIGADASCYSVACASIVAKVFRDRIMLGLDNIHPNYGLASHKGYGTKAHYEAILNYGLTPEHRRTFLKKI